MSRECAANLPALLCRFTGTLPREWSELTALQMVYAGANPGVTGTLPRSWSKLEELNYLNLESLPGRVVSGFQICGAGSVSRYRSKRSGA